MGISCPRYHNTFHASDGSLTHAPEDGARRVLKTFEPWRSIGIRVLCGSKSQKCASL